MPVVWYTHHKKFLYGYFFIPYVYLNFDRKKKMEVHGMSRSLRHLQLINLKVERKPLISEEFTLNDDKIRSRYAQAFKQ